MSQPSKKQATSPEIQEAASRIAKSTQKPGQSKEQTRLIAKGIEKGIEQYKKQQKVKSRELDKQLKSIQKKAASNPEAVVTTTIEYRQHWLPWALLLLSWLGAGVYYYLFYPH